MRRELEGDMVFDAGPILELIYSTSGGIRIREALKSEKLRCNISEVTLAEVSYILCRKLGIDESRARIRNLLESGYLSLQEISKIVEIAAEYKCKRALSLGDCFVIALAKMMNIPALFSKREDELVTEMSREALDVEVLFLEDLI